MTSSRIMAALAALLRHRTLRRVFAVNALLSLGWDLHTIFVPIYGAKIGLSASEIGGVLSSFAAATFVVRFFMPTIARRLREHQVLSAALLLARDGLLRVSVPAEAWRRCSSLSFCHARPRARTKLAAAGGVVAAAHSIAGRAACGETVRHQDGRS